MSKESLKLDNQLCFLFYSVSRVMTRLYGPLLSELGLTYPQYLAMLILWEKDHQEVGRFTELLHMDTGTVSPLLKRLQAAQLVTRERAYKDERRVTVSLTPKGRQLKRKAFLVPEKLFCKTGLTPEEYLFLKDKLGSLLLRMEEGSACKPSDHTLS
jgi:DNA-binding MarR family transcriptional regulator